MADRIGTGNCLEGPATARRWAGVSLVLIGAIFFVVFGFVLERRSANGSCDFEPVYYHARFLIQNQDPYVEEPARYVDLRSGGYLRSNTPTPANEISIPCVYPPTALLLVAPLALLKWKSAHLLWMALLAGSIITASFLMWIDSSDDAPLLSGSMICFLLINSLTLLFEANSAGLAVGLTVIASSLLLRQRFEAVGVSCLGVGLCLKPHDAAFVWLFFFLAGGVLRLRALQSLLVASIIGLPAILWVAHVSPEWRQEMSTNIAMISSPGGVNDPGPTSFTNQITASAINLQTVLAVFVNKPTFYNPATYLFSALVLLCIVWATLHNRQQRYKWLGMAAVSAFTMLPVYHRHHDARMLLLAVPACAVLWAENRIIGSVATVLTLLATAITGDIPRAVLEHLEEGRTFTASFSGKAEMAVFTRPAPIALVILTIFFLWLFKRYASSSSTPVR